MATLGEAVVGVGADTSGFEKDVHKGVESALSTASKSMENLGKKMQDTGKKLTVGVTLPLVGIGVSAINTQKNFETSMNLIEANIDGMTSGGKAALGELAKTLGADTVFSATEAADAMLELAKGGFSEAQIAGGGVQATMALAATEGLALADAATIVGNAMNAFGLEAEDASTIADMLAAGSAASSASVTSLAEGMANVGPIAQTLGVSMSDVVSTLSLFDQNALKGAEGGTALRNVFSRLTPQTKGAEDALRQLGVITEDGTNKFYTAEGSLKSVAEVAELLQNGLQGLSSDQERASVLMEAFGTYGQNAASILGGAGAEGLNTFSDAVNTVGKAQELADARMNGTAGAIEKMQGSLETAALAIGEALAPMISEAADFIGILADKFTNLSPTAQKFAVIAGVVAAALGPVLVVVGTLVASMGAIGTALAGVSLAAVAPVAAVVAIGVAIGLLIARSSKMRAVMMDAFNSIKEAVVPVVSSMVSMFKNQLLPALQDIWPAVEWLGTIWLKIFTGSIVGAIQGVMKVLNGAFKVITGIFQVIGGILKGDFGQVWDGLKNIVKGALEAILGLLQTALHVGVLAIFRKAFSLLIAIVVGAWDGIKAVFSAAMGAIWSAIVASWNAIKTAFTVSMQAIWTAIVASWNAIKAVFTGALNAIRTAIVFYFNAYIGVIQTVWNTILSVISAAWAAIIAVIDGAISAVSEAFVAVWDFVTGVFTGAWDTISSIVTGGVSALVSAITGIPGTIIGLGGSMLNAGKDFIGKFFQGLGQVGGFAADLGLDIVNGIITAINSVTQGINDFIPNSIPIPGLPDIDLPDNPIPRIPKFARGGIAPGGWAMTGERGPELVNLPRGSRVYSHQQSRRMADEGGSVAAAQPNIDITQNYFGPQVGSEKLQELDWTVRFAAGNRHGNGTRDKVLT